MAKSWSGNEVRMRSGDPGPDRPWRMLRVGPDLLFARKKHASSGRRLSKVRPGMR